MLTNSVVESREFIGGVEVLTARTASERLGIARTSAKQSLAKPQAPTPYATAPLGTKGLRTFWRADEALRYLLQIEEERITALRLGKKVLGRPRNN